MDLPVLEQIHTNRLVNETSPYLLQHAHNPVDWYPWGEEAFAKARAEDKPIFLSIGYSACHWCHVMERESFENPGIAALLNDDFVSIKVDREERPDIDEIYMAAVVAMTGQGGWPMSVFLTPDLKPFYGGTYYPPVDHYGRPGFATVLARIADTWQNRRDEVLKSADGLTDYIQKQVAGAGGEPGAVNAELIAGAATDLKRSFDRTDGGWGAAPKFPSSGSIALLLREYRRTRDTHVLHMATYTLDRMASGGMYDQLGGGFHRYSVDSEWLVPHFEKMLYDNAQLCIAYLEAYQVTGRPLYRRVAREILDYVLRDMRDPGGGFYSAEDADSEGEEGKFYLWTQRDIIDLLGLDDAEIFCRYYGVQEKGNFSSHESFHAGRNILHMPESHEVVAAALGETAEALEARMAPLRARLLEARALRVRPGLDDKVLTSWNALMIGAFAAGGRVLGEPRFLEAAKEAGQFLLDKMLRGDTLLRTHRKGESRLPGYLDDYAFTANAFLDLYETTGAVSWLDAAEDVAEAMLKRFWDEAQGCFFFTAEEHTQLLVRTRPTYDGAEPSGNSVGALALLRLSRLTDNPDHFHKAKRVLTVSAHAMRQWPRGYLKMLCAADFMVYPPKEIVIAGAAGKADTDELLRTVYAAFVPNKVVAVFDPSAPGAAALQLRVPLLEGKTLVNNRATAYVCENFVCDLPVTAPEDLQVKLRE